MNKTKLKQGTIDWEKAKLTRIGGSEIFDIVRYYATDEELQNCGIPSERFREEKPYTTAWALYHKLLNDGIYQKEELAPEFAEYGHAVEPYGLSILQEGRNKKLKAGEVYASDRLIASLDISGISEEIDVRPFNYGNGFVKVGKKFVCEQKSMMPSVVKGGLPFKYIIQAQYQIAMTGADFYILQIMVLKNDTVFERGKITQMPKKKRIEYLKDKMDVSVLYFDNNPHLSALIKTCIYRFLNDVDNCKEPTPYITTDTQKQIIESIRINTIYNPKLTLKTNLEKYAKAKKAYDEAEKVKKDCLQKIIEEAKEYNASRFEQETDEIIYSGSFSASGAFLLREKENKDGKI